MELTKAAYKVTTIEQRIELDALIAEALASGDDDRAQDARQAAEILEAYA